MAIRYPIPAETTRIDIRVEDSRFIATIGRAQSVEAAKIFVGELRREFYDATHNVFAYRVGYGASIIEGMSDDSEPPGTAGRPALAVLRGADLGDVVLVVTRYFGGTKLGTGGLVRAYTQAAQEALVALPRSEHVERRGGEIVIAYGLYERVKKLIVAQGGEIAAEEFGGDVKLQVSFAVDELGRFESLLTGLSGGKVDVRWLP